MTRLMIALSGAAAALTAGASALPAPAEAQANSVSEIIVYGNDPCPRSTDDQVVVCARRPEAERYRLPEQYRPSGTRQQKEAWGRKAKALETVGATGINSCSPVGPGGFTGCLTQVIKQARQDNRERSQEVAPPEE
ncbi:MAG TPA: hypothetical protein VJP82_08375 [Sphingomicrobium sp.]|jgi:hypothetical protein|nr:hypothetical protein [Sphingomicrobium sp.]